MKLGCESFQRNMSRRAFLKLGGAGLFGLTFADVLRAQANGRQPRARQAIFIFLAGGPPQQDMFDMKPAQPLEVRGPFRPIRTNVPGLDICEHLPRLSRCAHQYTVLRSVTSRGYPHAGDHHAGLAWKTGNPRALRGTPKYPMYGSVVAKLRSGPRDMPNFVAMGDVASMAQGLRENFLGPAYDPLHVEMGSRDPRQVDPLTQIIVPQGIDAAEFSRNAELVRSLDQQSRQLDAAGPVISGMDQFQQQAFDILRSPRLREALALDREPRPIRDRYLVEMQGYGRLNYTSRVLAARRLIEAGVPYVYVDFPYWDWHGGVAENNNAGMASLAGLDAALSALLEDLHVRGLLDTTLVMALGEMGRTPRMNRNGPAARDHWGACQFAILAGGGVRAGQVVGATDAQAAYVRDAEYKVASLGKTMYHLLGIDPDTELHTTDNRPLKLITEDVPLIREVL
jgi:hypothetical protein